MKKTFAILVSSLIFSTASFSAETFNVTGAQAKSLLELVVKAGAKNLGAVGSLNIGVKQIRCNSGMTIAGPMASMRSCHMVDKYSNADLKLSAVDAKNMFALMKKIGLKATVVPDASWIEATEISCTKVARPSAKPKCTVRE